MSGYQTDPNNSNKTIPTGLSSGSLSRATTPSPTIVSKAPSHVVITNSGSFSFAYQCSESIGQVRGDSTGLWEQGIVINQSGDAAFSPVKLDISPCAWTGSAAITTDALSAGDVTFVYKGK